MSRKAIVGALLTCMCGALGCAARLPDEVVWARQFGMTGRDEARGVCADATGMYVAGFVEGTLPGQTSPGGADAFVRKYDHEGVEVWTRQFGGEGPDSATGCCVGASGIYVVGHTQRTGPGVRLSGETQAFVRKYGADGALRWAREFGNVAVPYLGSVAVCSDRTGVYLAGAVSGALPGQTSAGRDDAFVRKYDADGNEEWTRQFGGPQGERAAAVCVGSGGVYVGGSTSGRLPGQPKGGNGDGFVAKYDAAGTQLWIHQFGGKHLDMVNAVWADDTGVYVAGDTVGALPGETQIGGSWDAFLKKYDPDGGELWTRQFGTGHPMGARALAAAPDGVLVAGATGGSFWRRRTTGQWDVYVRHYAANGAAMRTTELSDGKVAAALAIAASEGAVYVAGRAHGSLPGFKNAGGTDAFVAKVIVPEVGW